MDEVEVVEFSSSLFGRADKTWDAVSAEYEPVSLKNVVNYLRVLEELGFVRLVRK